MRIGRAGELRQWMAVVVAAVLPLLTGCSGFFVPENSSGGGGGGGGGSTTGNSVYVANSARSSLSGYSVIPAVPATAATATTPAVPATPATLTSITGLPTALGYQPLSMVVTPMNTFLYVSSVSGIRLYVINSNGSLTASAVNPTPAGVNATSMTISPDGQWLIALDGTTQVIDIFQINASTGALTSSSPTPTVTYAIKSGVWTPSSIRISPNGVLIFAALGTGGDAIFTFNTATGTAVSNGILNAPTTTSSDFGLAIDSTTTYLYIARSGTQGGVAVYSISGSGLLVPVSGSPFLAGSGTYDITLDSTGTYVYAANRTDGTISGYTIVPGTTTVGLTLKPLTSSPYASGLGVQSIGFDSTGKYLLAAAVGGSPDLTMYQLDDTVPGQLDQVTTEATDTDPAGASVVALTH
jgi:6-phosphogluconolactonase